MLLNVTFRIEDENYSYGTDVVLNIDGIPLDLVENLNNNNIYNQIKTGNNTDRTEDITIWQGNRLSGWTNEAFVGCGCYGLKDSVLDLTTDFITDGAIIEYVKGVPSGDDSGFEDAIFMYAVTTLAVPSPIPLVDFQSSGGIKNTFMWNEEVLKRWVGIANSCIALQRNTKYGFEINYTDGITFSQDEYGTGISFTSDRNNIIRYQNPPLSPNYDNQNSLYDQPNPPDQFTYFLCQENGDYGFNASSIFYQSGGSTPVLNADLYLSIEAWSGIGGTQIGYQEFVLNGANPSSNEYLMQLNAQFSLAVGNIVFVRYRMVYSDTGYRLWAVSGKNNIFKLISDNFSCDDLQDELGNFKPFEAEFEYPLCFNDYKALRANKRGIIRINGKDTWIKEIKYKPNDVSTIKVKYKESMCSC
ncbi:MAG: hypothetical protein IPK18_08440 [Sphingobacteriales bacterium]|nr:MAG: hypothetical protein IPK18_08440 [Sphingobacteriales bacterium]